MLVDRSIALTLLATTSGCMATYHVSPAEYVPANAPPEIAVMANNGLAYVLERPTIVGERLEGIQEGTADTIFVPVASVADATVRHKSTARTVLLIGALSAAGTGVVLMNRGGKGESCKLIWSQEDVIGKLSECEPTN